MCCRSTEGEPLSISLPLSLSLFISLSPSLSPSLSVCLTQLNPLSLFLSPSLRKPKSGNRHSRDLAEFRRVGGTGNPGGGGGQAFPLSEQSLGLWSDAKRIPITRYGVGGVGVVVLFTLFCSPLTVRSLLLFALTVRITQLTQLTVFA